MAYVYRGLNGKSLGEILAGLDGVKAVHEEKAFEIAVRAEELLLEHRLEGQAEIDIVKGDFDFYVVLSDEYGDKAALSIEYGREAGSKKVFNPKTGRRETVSWGAMEGLYILARASNLPKRRKGKVKL
ncbi:DUF5403 family protein [Kitasatospora sp. NPDC059800]|uniref:DUF5403 family protein n=1 Tax=Kitasatospora sp. NPDC059800 TaxID=3346951 RepID=UPI00365DBA2C